MSRRSKLACAGACFAFVVATSAEARASTNASDPATEADAPASAPMRRPDPKRFVVARDFGLAIPVGALADEAGPMYGPLVRLAFHPNDGVEVGIRAGYQRGMDKEVAGVTGSLSAVPVHASLRWFPLGRRSGPYWGAELGANVFRERHTARTSIWDVGADSTWVRPSAAVALGVVWSRSFPLDLRVQLASLDLVSRPAGPVSALTVGAGAGYSIFF